MRKNSPALFLIGIGVLLAGLAVSYLYWPVRGPNVLLLGDATIGGPFELTDHTGRAVTQESYRGDWKLVFFGFTHCPDICPTTLADVSRVLQLLEGDAERIRPLFITVDPLRDTPEILAEYTGFFDDRIIGLSGTSAQIEAVADAYGVYVEKVPMGDDYMINHTTFVYLMGPEGEFVQRFSQLDNRERMARQVSALMERGGS